MQQEKGQIQIIIIGLILIGGLIALNFTGILGGKKGGSIKKSPGQEITTSAASSIGPQRNNLYPTGTLPSGTRETTISVSTNEAALCRYSNTPGASYNSMSGTFSYNKEKTFHSTKVAYLEANKTYEYYVRCRNAVNSDIKNTDDAIIRFSVGLSAPAAGSYGGTSGGSSGLSGSDVIPPVISNLYPTGTLPSGTYETELSVSTNEAAYCRYSILSGTAYNSMSKSFSYDKSKLAHTVKITGLTDNKIYDYYVRCRDTAGNRNTSDVVIRFGVGSVNYSPATSPNQDITPPYRYDGLPDDDMPFSTKSTSISLKTDEKATCRYDTVSGVIFGQMKLFSNTNALTHSAQVSGFNEGETYSYFVKCSDTFNNINTDDYKISFKVKAPEDVTPPVITVVYPYNDLIVGTNEVQLGIQTNEAATCKYSTDQGTTYSLMRKSFTKEAANYHTTKVTELENNVWHSFFVRCKDTAGNANTGDIMISFRVTP